MGQTDSWKRTTRNAVCLHGHIKINHVTACLGSNSYSAWSCKSCWNAA